MSDSSKGLPSVGLEKFTVVFDLNENRPLYRIEGVVVLPVGGEIEQPSGHGNNLRVERVRLLTPGGKDGMVVCLDVRPLVVR